MAVRKQIVLPADVDARLRRLAAARGTSQSAIIAQAIRALPEPEEQWRRTMAFAGIIKEAPRDSSDHIDQVVYGECRD